MTVVVQSLYPKGTKRLHQVGALADTGQGSRDFKAQCLGLARNGKLQVGPHRTNHVMTKEMALSCYYGFGREGSHCGFPKLQTFFKLYTKSFRKKISKCHLQKGSASDRPFLSFESTSGKSWLSRCTGVQRGQHQHLDLESSDFTQNFKRAACGCRVAGFW